MKFVITALALAAGLLCAPAFADDEADKAAAAGRYFATMDFEADVNGVIGAVGQMMKNPAITPDQKQQFLTFAHDHIDRDMLRRAMIGAMIDTYTSEQLTALADFYGSPLGKSISAKNPVFNQALNRATIPVTLTFLGTYVRECTDKTKCLDMSMLMPPGAAPAPAPPAPVPVPAAKGP